MPPRHPMRRRIKVRLDRPSHGGRFGGGWHWKLGFQATRNFSSVVVNLLVFSVRFDRGT